MLKTVDASENKFELAGFGVRLGASLLDSLFITPFTVIGFYFFFYTKDFSLYAFFTFISFMYKPLMEGFFGFTLGKMVCKIKVVSNEFQKISFSTAIIRSLPWLFVSLSGLIDVYPLFSLDSFLNAGPEDAVLIQSQSDPKIAVYIFQMLLISSGLLILLKPKRGLHDYIAGTCCVKTNKKVKIIF